MPSNQSNSGDKQQSTATTSAQLLTSSSVTTAVSTTVTTISTSSAVPVPNSNSAATANNLLSAQQQEKPSHYTYLKEFRCEQCPLFLQHKCTQHKPFTCFNWHFMNQRRRRPIRKRDGYFNYSPDIYCTKYDETTGICQEGDECQYLHRTAGDTERRYHLRYYKTGICVYDTDSRGFCVKNGPHCAFAHGVQDLRNPVYDKREIQAMELGTSASLDNPSGGSVDNNSGLNVLMGPNSLDKERNALNDDPRWQDTTYVLANYKTELCKRPPRLCRQGCVCVYLIIYLLHFQLIRMFHFILIQVFFYHCSYACPQFHNNKDRRRSPKKYKYRSTPCPNVKQGDEWGDPANCDAGDSCPYCHTRTEQQFHPEIYKSTKCNDMQQTNYCPRGPFCAFAHVDSKLFLNTNIIYQIQLKLYIFPLKLLNLFVTEEISAPRDLNMDNSTDLASILSSALPQSATANNGEASESNPAKNQVRKLSLKSERWCFILLIK